MTGITNGRAEERAVRHTRLPNDEVLFQSYFRHVKKLGEGSFGVVSEAERLSDGTRWAIKTLQKEKAGSSKLKQLEREIHILRIISHPSIVCMDQLFETPSKLYLVIELCELGTLERQLERVGHYSELEAKPIMHQLANAIAYLHRNGIVHRDVKLDNVLCTRSPPRGYDTMYLMQKNRQEPTMYVKLSDFSLSATKEPDEMIESVCGTLIYMSPEVIGDRLYSQQCDVWAMGIIMYQLLAGFAPFRAKDELTLKALIREGQLDFGARLWTEVSAEAIDCIRKLLTVDTAYRIGASELLAHRWLNDTADARERPNVIELMKEFRLRQSDKQSSNGDDPQSPVSSSSDLQMSERNSSAGSASALVTNKYSYVSSHNRSEPKLNASVHRTLSSLSDSHSSSRLYNLADNRKFGQQSDQDRRKNVQRRTSAEEERANNNNNSFLAPRYASAARRSSPVRYVTNKRS